MIITDDDKKLIRKLIEIKNKGYYCSSDVLKNLYNRVFEANWKGTSCSSCMRAKVSELEKALKQWEEQEAKEAQKKAQEALKQDEPGNASSLHSNPLEMSTDTKAEENNAPETKKKRGRPKKEKEE